MGYHVRLWHTSWVVGRGCRLRGLDGSGGERGDTHPSSSAQSWLRGPKLCLLQRGFQHEQAANGMSFQVPRAA